MQAQSIRPCAHCATPISTSRKRSPVTGEIPSRIGLCDDHMAKREAKFREVDRQIRAAR